MLPLNFGNASELFVKQTHCLEHVDFFDEICEHINS